MHRKVAPGTPDRCHSCEDTASRGAAFRTDARGDPGLCAPNTQGGCCPSHIHATCKVGTRSAASCNTRPKVRCPWRRHGVGGHYSKWKLLFCQPASRFDLTSPKEIVVLGELQGQRVPTQLDAQECVHGAQPRSFLNTPKPTQEEVTGL